MESNQTKNYERSKLIRLIDFLAQLTLLRTRLVRKVEDYQRILWLSSIPHEKGCFTQAWGREEDVDSDIWIEVQSQNEPELPRIPSKCVDWVDLVLLRNKADIPEIQSQITVQVKNIEWQDDNDEPEYIPQKIFLEDNPDVKQDWDTYLERWLSWTVDHDRWERIHEVYSILFTIHQEQVRLGEEYELVLAVGLLTWKTPKGQLVSRHLVVANARLEVEANLGKFTVGPMTDGATVRPELDMLDIEDRPLSAEEIAKESLSNTDDDPWKKGSVEGVLKSLVHSISPQGEYHNTLDKNKYPASEKPIVEYAPALILRKRSAKGLTEILAKIRNHIENGEDIPGEFGCLAELQQKNKAEPDHSQEEINKIFDGEIFFPKSSNNEQLTIVDKIRTANGVLVQGPPGTGKSHTIANLICHLLATGQRILITSKTPRALQVLNNLVPDELRSLCINLLGYGLEESQSLESSVNGILRKNDEWDENHAKRECMEIEGRLLSLRKESQTVNRRLRDIRESETHSMSFADGAYVGTASKIAKAVDNDSNKYNWFKDVDDTTVHKPCPVSESDLKSVLAALRYFTPEKRSELSCTRINNLPVSESFANLVENESNAIENEAVEISGADESIADRLSKSTITEIKSIHEALTNYDGKLRNLRASPQDWLQKALMDILSGYYSFWSDLLRLTKEVIDTIASLVDLADQTTINIPDNININALQKDVERLKAYTKTGGKLGWGPFRPKIVKDRIHVIKMVYVNGRRCSKFNDFSTLADVLTVQTSIEKAWSQWIGRAEKPQGTYRLQLTTLKSLYNTLENALSLGELIEKCCKAMRHSSIIEPLWSDRSQIEKLIASCRLAHARHNKDCVENEICQIEKMVSSVAEKDCSHPIASKLLNAIRDRDINTYKQAESKCQDLEKEYHRLQNLEKDIVKLNRTIPKLIAELQQNSSDHSWEERLQRIVEAWRWAQAQYRVNEYISKDDIPALTSRARQIEDEIKISITKLASLNAWSSCFARLKSEHRQHMEAWQQSIGRLGKGTGKYAPRHRREAQQHLNQCREAVPAWVMPLYRLWDTVAPAPEMFDIIIVDEASQCGFEALPLFYLGKKILIVGDDQQISPEAVGLPQGDVHQLIHKFLYDFEFKSSFDITSSLFDHGKLRFSDNRVTLREHFRCMPEIIRFSNDLCYSDTPLIPLRQYESDRLSPLEHIFVNDGYREGKGDRVINKPEANAIVEKIVELCKDDRYSNKTMGVIVLQGSAQGSLIEEKLLRQLGAEEIEKRRIVCGNPYSFQGDERDVIFISMIAAPDKIGEVKEGRTDKKRYNVAMSRGRDQVWLFHSVRCEDLSHKYLRRKLLDFFQSTGSQEIAGIEKEILERHAYQDNRNLVQPPPPFDSWFELDVALELLRKGFVVLAQYEVAGKRIDLVVDGGRSRLAVECDGDRWHGVDSYEADMQRQRQLERCGWEFFRVRESVFYANKELSLAPLWRILEERGINSERQEDINEVPKDENKKDVTGENDACVIENTVTNQEGRSPQATKEITEERTDRRPEDVTASEISAAIIKALEKCSNHSCVFKDLTKLVLKELGILTRSKPREKFKSRVNRNVSSLEKKGVIEKYKAKNLRVRLTSGPRLF